MQFRALLHERLCVWRCALRPPASVAKFPGTGFKLLRLKGRGRGKRGMAEKVTLVWERTGGLSNQGVLIGH